MSAAAMHTAHSPRALRVNGKAADLDALRLEAAPQAEPVPPPGQRLASFDAFCAEAPVDQ